MPARVPHFSLPFRFSPPAATSEQNSIDEIGDCCAVILLCPQGFRVELPEFGLPDPTFSSPVVDVDVIRTVVDRWEPRAALLLEEGPDVTDQLVRRVQTIVQVRTEE
jgi:phage baseplate assembly protein W